MHSTYTHCVYCVLLHCLFAFSWLFIVIGFVDDILHIPYVIYYSRNCFGLLFFFVCVHFFGLITLSCSSYFLFFFFYSFSFFLACCQPTYFHATQCRFDCCTQKKNKFKSTLSDSFYAFCPSIVSELSKIARLIEPLNHPFKTNQKWNFFFPFAVDFSKLVGVFFLTEFNSQK